MTLGLGVHPKILKIFLGVPPQILKKVGVLPGAAKGFCLRREAAPAIRHKKIFKNLGCTPNPKVIKM